MFAYVSDLDATGHRRGVDSPALARAAWSASTLSLEALVAQLPSDALLLVTGDHGMVDVDLDTAAEVETDSALSDGVVAARRGTAVPARLHEARRRRGRALGLA